MGDKSLRGQVHPVQLIAFVVLLVGVCFVSYKAFRWFVPPVMSIAGIERVDALEALSEVSTRHRKNIMHNDKPRMVCGGSQRLVVTRPSADGHFLLVHVVVAGHFLKSKAPPDKWKMMKIDLSRLSVQGADGPVDALLLSSDQVESPANLDASVLIPTNSREEISLPKYPGDGISPRPQGEYESISGAIRIESENDRNKEFDISGGGGTFRGATGMKVDWVLIAEGTQAILSVTWDAQSQGWVELKRSIRHKDRYLESSDLKIVLLVPLPQDENDKYDISLYDESVATIALP